MSEIGNRKMTVNAWSRVYSWMFANLLFLAGSSVKSVTLPLFRLLVNGDLALISALLPECFSAAVNHEILHPNTVHTFNAV